MPKTKTRDRFEIHKEEGTATLAFVPLGETNEVVIELGQIRNGQLERLKKELEPIDAEILRINQENLREAREVKFYNDKHADDPKVMPKTFTPQGIAQIDVFGPWIRAVVEELSDPALLPDDTDSWPVWLCQRKTAEKLVELWTFSPLDLGDE